MAQGTQKLSKGKATSKKPQILAPKKGKRVIAPKRQSLIKQNAVKKKITSGLTAKTERNLAEKAGHLELLKGGKADKKKTEKPAK